MKFILTFLLYTTIVFAQASGDFHVSMNDGNPGHSGESAKLKKSKKFYLGVGYSFVGFTDRIMSIGYPFLDVKSGDLVSELNLFFGYSFSKTIAIELEPSISFSRNYRFEKIDLTTPYSINNEKYNYDFPVRKSYYAYPLAVNLKIFPFSGSKGFGRMFFIGGAAGVIFVKEEYDHRFTNNPSYTGFGDTTRDVVGQITSSSQNPSPLFRAIMGIRTTGKIINFGGEIRYTFISLKQSSEPFRTRMAKNGNNIDIVLRIAYEL